MKAKIELMRKYWVSDRRFRYAYFNNWIAKRKIITENLPKGANQ